ncbi:ABC transporter substrate-binding protein [Rhodovarius crocodyli]|uniref:ABC transporter substrate-binding protein n=1 Tax=Rhodovarius crocodyli TaxID=1979269 RepID=A0A437MP50_9PROT|nr:ABC transporter substrate-binding protein [Rhodovarius crocodyli]RVT99431.1 ABC transporter substrate-binding protein [Rhodovarius crocodyli]
MIDRRTLAASTAALFAPRVLRAQGVTEITVHYAQPVIYKESYDAIAAEFAKREPNIRINWVTTPNYEEGMQLVLRQQATNQTIDLSYQAFNRLRLFAERGIAQDLLPMLRASGDYAAEGYSPNMLALAHFGGMQAGLAYAASNPIMYYNADLVRRAGGNPDAMPTSWDGIIELAKKIEALGNGIEGMWYSWPGDDWMFSALLFGYGGRMLTEDERDVAFTGPEGLNALKLLDRMVKEGGMPNLTRDAAQQAFAAGRMGMTFWTTAAVRGTIQQVGRNFELRTGPMPIIDAERGRLPTGGAAGMLITKDAAKREAAWKFLRFSTSAEGTALMARNTGYVPTNQLAIDQDRYLGEFYRANPLFQAATRQASLMIPWYAFPGANSVRVTQTMVDQQARIVEQSATPEQVLADMGREVRRLLPRPRG